MEMDSESDSEEKAADAAEMGGAPSEQLSQKIKNAEAKVADANTKAGKMMEAEKKPVDVKAVEKKSNLVPVIEEGESDSEEEELEEETDSEEEVAGGFSYVQQAQRFSPGAFSNKLPGGISKSEFQVLCPCQHVYRRLIYSSYQTVIRLL